jgi:hypothetical protein
MKFLGLYCNKFLRQNLNPRANKLECSSLSHFFQPLSTQSMPERLVPLLGVHLCRGLTPGLAPVYSTRMELF